MTEKAAREYLNSIAKYEKQLKDKINQILELKTVAESCTVSPEKENIQSSGSGDKMANIVGRIVDLEDEILIIHKLIIARKRIVKEIAGEIDKPHYGQFLVLRYVDGNGFYDTAAIMNLKDTTAKRMNRKSVAEFSKIYTEKY